MTDEVLVSGQLGERSVGPRSAEVGAHTLLLAVMFALTAWRLPAQPASPCYPAALVQTDSLRAETYRKANNGAILAPRATVVRRLASRIDSILVTGCPVAPPPPPAITWRLTLTQTDSVLRVRPLLPYSILVQARVDSNGIQVRDSAAFVSSDTSKAAIWWNAAQRRLEVYNAHGSNGTITVTGTWGTLSAQVQIRVEVTTAPPPPPPPPPLGAIVQVNTGTTFQTISGWQSNPNDYWLDCPAVGAYDRYRTELHDRVVTELGINRLTVGLASGNENSVDYYSQWRAGTITRAEYRPHWYWPENDNADPFVTDSSKFYFRPLFDVVDTVAVSLRQRLAARGEALYLVLTIVDFKTASHGNLARPYDLVANANEYAEFVTMAFVRFQQRYGWVPDALEISLEPENGGGVYGPEMGRAIAAARARLAGKGFTPQIIAHSNVAAFNVAGYMQQGTAAGGTPDVVNYHRYNTTPTDSILRGIAALGRPTTMLEYNEGTSGDSLFAFLLQDLTLANVTAWESYTLASCGSPANLNLPGVYYHVDTSNPLAPVVNLTQFSKLLRHVFAYVRRGAARVGAASGSATLQPVAFRSTTGAITVVTRALGAGSFGIDGLPAGSYGVNYSLADGSAWNVEQPMQSIGAGGRLTVSIPARGVVTVYGLAAAPPPPLPPPASGAELPRLTPTFPAGLDARPCTVQVTTQLQAALGAARGGAVLCLAPQSRHVGRFFIPARVAGDTGWIVLRTAPSAALGAGRIRPSQSGPLAKIVSPSTLAALEVLAYARQVLMLGLELTSDSLLAVGPTNLVIIGGFGDAGGSESSVAQLPADIVFDRVYAHGWPHQDVRRAFAANGAAQTFIRSWCEEIHQFNADSQCIAAWNSPGPILIEDNHLSAASENITTGGSDPAIPGVFARDVTIRRNHLFKPDAWLTGTNWNVKNVFESKAVQRLLIENNVFDGNWFGAAPGHAAIVLKSTNPNGGCRQCYTSDVTIRRNLFQRVGVWLSLAGRADATVGAPASDSTNQRIALVENWADSITVGPYTNQNRYNITYTSQNTDVWIERNTFAGAGPTLEGAIIFGLDGPVQPPVTNLTVRNNVFPKGIYGMGASSIGEGDKAWKAGAAGVSIYANNAFLGSSTVVYPPGTTWHSSLTSALGVAGVARATVAAGVAGVVITR